MIDVRAEVSGVYLPDWILERAEPQSVRVYAAIAGRFLRSDNPSRAAIARFLEVSDKTVQRAIANLEAIGAIIVRRTWDEKTMLWSTNEYVVKMAPPEIENVDTGADGTSLGVPPPVSRKDLEVQEQELDQELTPSGADTGVRGATGADKPRRDEVWDAVEAACGPVTNAGTRSKRGKAVKLILESMPDDWDLGQAAKAIGYRVKKFRESFPGAVLTDTALANQWDSLAPPRPAKGVRPMVCTDCEVGGGHHTADCPQANGKAA